MDSVSFSGPDGLQWTQLALVDSVSLVGLMALVSSIGFNGLAEL